MVMIIAVINYTMFLIRTKYSEYQFDTDNSYYRKIKPHLGEWKFYMGFLSEPEIGTRLKIIRNLEGSITQTSVVIEIQDE